MDEKFLKIAELELRETEVRRNQTLAQLREWIDKHSFLSKIIQDDDFLIQFLRSTNFNVNLSCKKIEEFYLMKKRYPQLFSMADDDHARMLKLLQNRILFPLSQRDENGNKVVIYRPGKRDRKIFSTQDEIRVNSYMFWLLQKEQETQIAGYSIIIDSTYLKPETAHSPAEVKIVVGQAREAIGIRLRKMIFINTPTWVEYLMDIIKFFINERLITLKHQNELSSYIKPMSILTKEFGGDADEDEEFSKFLNLLEKYEDKARKTWDPEIEWNNVSEEVLMSGREFENVGSFIKLEAE